MAVIQMPDGSGKGGSAVLKKWHKRTGDWVSIGDELFTFDAEDGSYTVKSQKAGRLVAIFVPEGEIVKCPADVGMLSPATPESVLSPGTTPFTAAEEEKKAEEAAAAQETEQEDISEEIEETVAEESAPEEAVTEEPLEEEAEEETEEAAEEEPEEEEEDSEEPDIEVEFSVEPENLPPRPANLTAQVNGEELSEIGKRTGISLGAMVAFAALHTGAKEYMEPCPETLKELNEAGNPNICDLSSTHIVRSNVTMDGKLTFIVPALEKESHALNLSLCFDQNEIAVEKACEILEETAKNLENFLTFALLGNQ